MSLLDRQLPTPVFVECDPEKITRELIARYEELTGKVLYPAQLERLLIDVIAYRENLVREAIQDAALLNLVRFSRGSALDCLGENVGVARLAAARAQTTVRLRFSRAPTEDTVLPAGVRVRIGAHMFATASSIVVAAASRSIDVTVVACEAGVLGNGIVPGECVLIDAISPLVCEAVESLAVTEGGAEEESDARLRERIVVAPETFSVAGSRQAYWFHAMSAHPDITDVAVFSHTPGVVSLYPMTASGIASQAVKDAVASRVSADAVRPLTDRVEVCDAQPVDYALDVQIILTRTADSRLVQTLVENAAAQFVSEHVRLGSDIVVSQIIDALHVYGVYSVVVSEPAVDVVVQPWGWPRCTSCVVTLTGVADE